jgi:homoserine/homoserine lactone efflux protein
MKLYTLFLLMATATVVSPGPGVVMTLSNSLRHGLKGTLGGILGIAAGALVVAAVSATSLGVLLATSATAFTVMKYVGAAYLVYLGIRLWRAPAISYTDSGAPDVGFSRRFVEGVSLQLTNPKAVFFFLSVFPQFIDPHEGYIGQFLLLVLSYSALVIVIHTTYALTARRARTWLSSARGGRLLNRIGAATFIIFGVTLAAARKSA